LLNFYPHSPGVTTVAIFIAIFIVSRYCDPDNSKSLIDYLSQKPICSGNIMKIVIHNFFPLMLNEGENFRLEAKLTNLSSTPYRFCF